MTRVLFVEGAAERGGAQRILLALARHLPAFGVEPVVAFVGVDGPFASEVRAAGIEAVVLAPQARVREIWRAPAVVRAVAGAARDYRASILHANGEKMAVFTRWAARRAGVPAVVWLHDEPRRSREATFVELAMLASPAATNVTPSHWLARRYAQSLRLHPRVIPLGIDLESMPAQPVDPRVEAGWPASSLVVGHFGRLQHWKGADVFLRAAATVAERHPAARFVVAGGALYGWDADYAAGLPDLAHRLGIADRVWFSGHRDDAWALMAGCDAVVHSSRAGEPFGLVVVEAMAAGSAVVASRTGGPEEIVRDGETGLLTPPDEPAALASALDTLLSEPTTRARLTAAARDDVHLRFVAPAMAGAFASLYEQLARRLPSTNPPAPTTPAGVGQ